MTERMSDERLAELKRLLETADYKIYTHSKELVAGMEAERAKVEELEAKLERVEKVILDLDTQCTNAHATKMLRTALKERTDE